MKKFVSTLIAAGGAKSAALVLSAIALSQATTVRADEARQCARLFKGVDFSTLDNGNAATSVTKAKFVRAYEMDKEEAHWAHEFSRILGAPTKYGMKKLPDHCLVEGYVPPTIRFQIRLPAKAD
ncbi:MAG: hypothetical protein OIF35_10785, partial [Cellvibrionaceae bacterium]|nr:hypothetical protein [Cellvibrionaceae bacterium]